MQLQAKFLFLVFAAVFCFSGSFGQSKVFFDKAGKSVSESNAYYYRVAEGDRYKSYFVNGGGVYFDGAILTPSSADEDKNVYRGTCKWFFKNGNPKAVRKFNDQGVEDGLSIYYYESGKLWKEINYVNGQVAGNRFVEYNEDGSSSRIFEDEFINNANDWDLYKSDKSQCELKDGALVLTSLTKEGTGRYISLPIEASDFAIELIQNIKDLKEGEKSGVIYGFKDWQNYSYFAISQSSFFIGHVYEGVNSVDADGMFASSIVRQSKNNLKILSDGNDVIFTINGEIQFKKEQNRLTGSYVGFVISGKSSVSFDKLVVKEIDFKNSGAGVTVSSSDMDIKATGSGLIISKSGYIVTNHHVIENANKVVIEHKVDGVTKLYSATVVQQDKENDLAILKISDNSYQQPASIPFSFKDNGVDVGASVFTIGYPFALSGMGKEAKFTDGKISAKTGFNNAINAFQTSIPVQPGNSGGPVFTEKGQLVGVIQSSIHSADNVSYAIKLNYIKNLLDLLPETVETPKGEIEEKPLEEKVKTISNFVVLIKIK